MDHNRGRGRDPDHERKPPRRVKSEVVQSTKSDKGSNGRGGVSNKGRAAPSARDASALRGKSDVCSAPSRSKSSGAEPASTLSQMRESAQRYKEQNHSEGQRTCPTKPLPNSSSHISQEKASNSDPHIPSDSSRSTKTPPASSSSRPESTMSSRSTPDSSRTKRSASESGSSRSKTEQTSKSKDTEIKRSDSVRKTPSSSGGDKDRGESRSDELNRSQGRSRRGSRGRRRSRSRSRSRSRGRGRSLSMSLDGFSDEETDDEEEGRKRRRRRRKRRKRGEGLGSSHHDRYRNYYKRARKARLAASMYNITSRDDLSWKKCMGYIVPIACIIGGVVGILVATGNGDKISADSIRGFVPILDPGEAEDPFAGTSSIPKWKTNGRGGLTVDLVNALQDAWQVTFALAVADWDFGNPDALSLSSKEEPYDFSCSAVPGKIKVCNGDYGAVKWRGINQAVLDNGYITASAAKMNEYYLAPDDEAARSYTMCHELGHAFGLPHSDENFENTDLGNCMDYSNNFDFSKHPDESNYKYLVDLYGEVGKGRRRQLGTNETSISTWRSIPQHIHKKMQDAVQSLEQRLDDKAHEDGWTLMHRNKRGEMHRMTLGDGYHVQVHMLLA